MKCIYCGGSYFSEHKNVLIFKEKGHYFHAFHKGLNIGYSILKCNKCMKKYIARKRYYSETIDKLIPVENFSFIDANEFLTRSKLVYPNYLHLDYNFASEMVLNEI